VATSVVRKPAPEFFDYALSRCGLARENALFVGNQLNTDVAGAAAYGIASVWLAGPEFRSHDDRPCAVSPTYTIGTLQELPSLLRRRR
jgi:FMN phosphatase YigB (HAD superfamily)